jgi:(p)ppGpp synthase/HD superfamily hydrolase
MNKLSKAYNFAKNAHGDQLYGGKPYMFHLQQVVDILKEYNYFSEDLLSAGYLHDTLEDTSVSSKELVEEFGEYVANLVFAVTGQGATRAERTKDTIIKLKCIPEAVPLKMADRLANMRFSAINGRKHINMYVKELPKYETVFYGFMLNEMRTFRYVPE